MNVLITDVRQPLGEGDDRIAGLLAAQCGLEEGRIRSARVVRRSLDARKKQEIHFLLNVVADLDDALVKKLLSRGERRFSLYGEPETPPLPRGSERAGGRIAAVGLGPAGLFAALLLAQNGYAPLVIERGEPVEARARSVGRYWGGGELSEESNVLFGEGGAGTFSDGKLTSRSKDARGERVLETFVRFGAPEEIAILAKPHIGTDRLRTVVSAMRREIERLGGEVRFNTRLDALETKNGAVSRIVLCHNGERETLECAALVLAAGQGARDTYQMLLDAGVAMVKKPFAVGLRIEHPQAVIDRAQYGAFAGHPRLGAADYRLTAESGDRGVYTFCMCPGGRVIASASAQGEIVVNGMSDYARNAKNANAAVVVQVRENDLADDPMAGVRFQREIERAAFRAGGANGFAPACSVGAFLSRTAVLETDGVEPSYRPGVTAANLWNVLPDFVAKGVADGIAAFGRQLRGFDDPGAVLTGVETRTSAPLRILRGESMESVSFAGLYPVGEGAGYAGGIVSAAIDGMKAAERVMARFAPND